MSHHHYHKYLCHTRLPKQPYFLTHKDGPLFCIKFIYVIILFSCIVISRNIGASSPGCSISFYDDNMQVIQTLSLPSPPPVQDGRQSSRRLVQDKLSERNYPDSQVFGKGLECQNITGEELHDLFNMAKWVNNHNLKMISLAVRDSNLSTLGNLPQGLDELKRLVISNTSIDLEVLKEGSESLNQLSTLEISNEKISNIPQNFFEKMQSLKELRLENNGIASLDSDAFHNLDDSLEFLGLRNNRFNRFPMTVKNLAGLSVLDLSDNDIVIDTQESDLPEKLEQLLNLHELLMNRINCTCEFGQSPFYEWIARTHISGVRCFTPEKLKSEEVIVVQRDEFCGGTSAASSYYLLNEYYILTLIVLAFSVHQFYVNIR